MSPIADASASPARRALRIAAWYLVISAAWIVFTDLAVDRLALDPVAARWHQTWKGLVFVGLSALLIYLLVRQGMRDAVQGSERLRALVEQSLAGIYLIRSGRFLYVNPALAETFGYTPAEMVEEVAVAEVVAEEDRDRVLDELARRERGEEEEMRTRFHGVQRSGGSLRVEVHGRRVLWEGAPAVLGVLVEVGRRERLERQVREAQRLKALGELTGQIAHDFNNFLTGVVGPLELALDRIPEGHDARSELDQARETALSAAALTRKLLAFSRKRPSLARPVEVHRLLERMRGLLERLVGPSVSLDLALVDAPCVASVDPSDLEQIVMILVINAGEAMPGGGTVTIRTGREAREDDGPPGVRIEVEDEGTGMSPEVAARVFEPFFTTKSEGTGLGLSTVYGVVAQTGGSVEVESEPGRGTRFTVRLPGSAESEPLGGQEPEEPETLEGDETILLVEDEPVVLDVTERALRRHGYDVHAAADGRQAFERARELGRVDLLLTDIQLPDTIGPEVAREVTELHPEARVVFFSGFSNETEVARLARTPDARLVHKPYVLADLLGAIRAALDDGGGDRGSEGRASPGGGEG